MSQKMGFWSVFSIVAGSQIGSSILTSPALLAPFGILGIIGWIISGCGAMALSFVFAALCARFPKTGGPHFYVQQAFGKTAAFFTGWTYWVVSWVSTTAVIFTIVSYLSPLLPYTNSSLYLLLEIIILALITLLNLRGVAIAGFVELFLTASKFLWLFILPAIGLYYFNYNNIATTQEIISLPLLAVLGQTTLLTFWGFIGLESGTVPAEAVVNPSQTIPRAVIFGTLSVALLYILNSISIMGLIPGTILAQSDAPYTTATQILFGGNWHMLISLIAAIFCIGTLNAWVLTSSQIALGLAENGYMPEVFLKKNKAGSPVWSLIISSASIIPLLCLMINNSLMHQIQNIIDISVISFIFIYGMCALALITLLRREKSSCIYYIPALLVIGFCSWIIYETSLQTLLIASLFTLSGLPLYAFWYKQKSVTV